MSTYFIATVTLGNVYELDFQYVTDTGIVNATMKQKEEGGGE